MQEDIYTRTTMLIGESAVEKLRFAKVLICGVGGVGGYVVEALARVGIGNIDVLDNDVFSISNLNRQILSTMQTIGNSKTKTAKSRILDINPQCKVTCFDIFYLPSTADSIDISGYDYIIDAMDTVTAKIELIVRAKAMGINIISSMGTGNKMGTNFEVADIYKTSVCPLAKVMRKELKLKNVQNLKVVYSKENPISLSVNVEENGRHIPGSICYAPAIAGLTIASEVIKDIITS